jgi:hypothetical protein
LTEAFESFRSLVLREPALLEELRATGDLSSFLELAVRRGAERGCVFSEDEVRASLRLWRRLWLEREI